MCTTKGCTAKQIPSFRWARIHYINDLSFFHRVPFSDTHQSKPTDTSASLFPLLRELFSFFPPLILMIMPGPVGAHCVHHINYLIIYWQFICFHQCLCASCFYALLCFCTYLVVYGSHSAPTARWIALLGTKQVLGVWPLQRSFLRWCVMKSEIAVFVNIGSFSPEDIVF